MIAIGILGKVWLNYAQYVVMFSTTHYGVADGVKCSLFELWSIRG